MSQVSTLTCRPSEAHCRRVVYDNGPLRPINVKRCLEGDGPVAQWPYKVSMSIDVTRGLKLT